MFVGPPFHAMPFARHVDYAASSVFINLTDTRKWFGKERAQWHLNPRTQNKHKGKEGAPRSASHAHVLSCLCSGVAGSGLPPLIYPPHPEQAKGQGGWGLAPPRGASSLAHALSCPCSDVAGGHRVSGRAEHACHPAMHKAKTTASCMEAGLGWIGFV